MLYTCADSARNYRVVRLCLAVMLTMSVAAMDHSQALSQLDIIQQSTAATEAGHDIRQYADDIHISCQLQALQVVDEAGIGIAVSRIRIRSRSSHGARYRTGTALSISVQCKKLVN